MEESKTLVDKDLIWCQFCGIYHTCMSSRNQNCPRDGKLQILGLNFLSEMRYREWKVEGLALESLTVSLSMEQRCVWPPQPHQDHVVQTVSKWLSGYESVQFLGDVTSIRTILWHGKFLSRIFSKPPGKDLSHSHDSVIFQLWLELFLLLLVMHRFLVQSPSLPAALLDHASHC